MPPVDDWYDPTGGLPADPGVGDRYISDATANGWEIDHIYEWDGSTWVESEPEEGWMIWMLFELIFYVFFSGGWMEVGDDSYVNVAGDTMVGRLLHTLAVRGATSLWYRATHIPAFSLSPGASGATFVAPDANTIGGQRLTALNHYLYSGDSVTSQWDGASDLEIRVTFEVNVDNTGGADEDTVDLRLICYYKGNGETTVKSQTIEEPKIVGKSARYKRFTTIFVIDWDVAGNIVEVGDKIHFRLNLETDTSEVDDIIVNTIMYRYKTAKMNPEV